MANIIVVKHRTGSSGEPTGLLAGEIAANINDKILCIGTGAGNIVFADKAYIDNQLSGKADSSSVYTQTQIDNFLTNKANAADVYTKTQLDGFLNAKANQSTTYTKTEVDGLISGLIDSAPAALDTIKELADALNGDSDFHTTMTSLINAKLSDAPSDGNSYIRQDGAWIQGGGVDISNESIDGGTY